MRAKAKPTSAGAGTAPNVYVRAWRPMPPEEWARIFQDWPEDDPRWRALWDCLSFHLEAELGQIGAIGAKPEEVMQWSGRIQMLLFVRTQLLQLRKATV